MGDDPEDLAAKEAAYLENITKRKQQKFASKVFGGLEAAREGKAPVHHSGLDAHSATKSPVSPRSTSTSYGGGHSYGSPSHHTQPSSPSQPTSPPVKKTWNPPVETVHHEPVNRQPVNSSANHAYGEIDSTPLISKRDESDLEEALRREEERMNKKLSHTAPVGTVMGGLQPGGGVQPKQSSGIYGGPTSPRHNVHTTAPVSPRSNWAQPTPVHAHTTHQPVHQQPVNRPVESGAICSCGTHLAPNSKFCAECGKPCTPSSPQQSSQPTGRYGEIDSTPVISKRDESDVEEALRREEERMNKKLGNTAPQNVSGQQVTYGGLQPANQQQHLAHQPSSPVHQPVHAKPAQQQQYVLQETVTLSPAPSNNNSGLKGPGVFCTFDVPGNPASTEERPKMNVDQSSSYLFTPVPGKLGVNVECLVEGSDVIKFKLTTTGNAVVVQKYSMPFPIGREHLKRKGNAVELDPF